MIHPALLNAWTLEVGGDITPMFQWNIPDSEITNNRIERERGAIRMFGIDYNVGGQESTIANCLSRRYDDGVSRWKKEGTAVGIVIDDSGELPSKR